MAKKKNKIQKIKHSLKAAPNNVDFILELVRAYKETGDFKNAIKCLNQYKKNLSQPDSDIELADIYAQQGQLEEAITLYETVLAALKPTQESEKLAFVYKNLAELLVDKNAFQAKYFYWHSLKYLDDKTVLKKLNHLTFHLCTHLNNGWGIIKHEGTIEAILFTKKAQNNVLSYHKNDDSQQFWARYIATLEKLPRNLTEIEFLVNIIKEKEIFLAKTENSLILNKIMEKWVYCLVSLLEHKQWKFYLIIFEIQIFLIKHNYLLPDEAKSKLLKVKSELKASALLPIHQFAYQIIVFFVDTFLFSLEQALNTLVTCFYVLAEDDPSVLYFSMLVWHQFFHIGYFNHSHQLVNNLLIFCGEKFSEFGISSSFHIFPIFYKISNKRDWNQLVFEKIVIPSVLVALKRNDFLYADRLLILTDVSYAQQPMTEIHRKACRDQYIDVLHSESLALSHSTKSSVPKKNNSTHNKIVIGFVVSLLLNRSSPVKLLLSAITAIQKLSLNFEFKLYAFNGSNEVAEQFKQQNVEVIDFNQERGFVAFDDYKDRLFTLRNTIQAANVDIIVFIQCNVFFMMLASHLKLAPVQVFWSAGAEHSFHIPSIQEYITMAEIRETEKIIEGHRWRTFFGLDSDDFEPIDSLKNQEIKALRAKFPQDAIILGSICRAEKLDDEVFISALASIMAEDSNTIFLWFGQEELTNVVQKMKKYGIYERCFFQGWVSNPPLYAAILDIYLETFGYPASSPAFQSMVLGRPVVMFHAEESLQASSLGRILPAMKYEDVRACFFVEGEQLLLYADNQERYIQHAVKLLKNEAFRQRVGLAGKVFIDNIVRKEDIGKYLMNHFLDIKHQYLDPA